MGTYLFPASTRDLTPEVFDEAGRFQVLPAEFWRGTTPEERTLLAVQQGMYVLPTVELVRRLATPIAGRRAIEIGARNGVVAHALGIHANDNHMQALPRYRAHYERMRQAPVDYGRHVEVLDAHAAIDRYRPQVVVGAWVTHRYVAERHAAGGNEIGVDEDEVLDQVDTYLFVGNETVHAGKPIWARPHSIAHPDSCTRER